MAIKTISKLDPYANDADGCVGGSIHLYQQNNSNDQIPETKDPQGKSYQATVAFDEAKNYNMLFEVSKPATKTGAAGLTDAEFESYKLTYKDLVANVILDTKSYLNARNNLGDFDLCSMVYSDYYFKGDKSFNGDVNVYSDLSVKGSAKIDTNLTASGPVNFGSTLYVASNLTCNGDICGKGALSVVGALYTATLSSDSTGTIIKPGTNGFIVQNVLSAKTDKVVVDPAVQINNNLTSTGSGSFGSVSVTGSGSFGSVSVTGSGSFGSVSVTGSGSFGSVSVTGSGSFGSVSVTGSGSFGSVSVTGNQSIGGNLTVTGSGTFGSLTCNGNCELTANHAKWSDLAEYYKADSAYEPGTLVKFGGVNEVTAADTEVNAVVTSKPAFLMNCGMKEDPLGCAIALAGRVPVRVIGKVKKFDKIVLSGQRGIARAIDADEDFFLETVIGRALESNDAEEVKLVECVVKFEL